MILAAFGAAAAFLVSSEKQLRTIAASASTFDVHAREAVDALADVRAAEEAYLVPGQGLPFWMHKVATTVDVVRPNIAGLRQSSGSTAALSALVDADAALTEFENIDRRAREYMNAGQQLMASDVIFTEATQTAAAAGHQIEGARVAERQVADSKSAAIRRSEGLAAGGAAAFAFVMMLTLVPRPRQDDAAGIAATPESEEFARVVARPQPAPAKHEPAFPADTPVSPTGRIRMTTSPVLKAAAELAVAFGRVNEAGELERLMARTADVLDASGIVVWMGNSMGGDLRPVVTHGYSSQAVSRMPKVARGADNAAAAAYRTGELQIVPSRPGFRGAVVAPILRADGCVGALSAEIQDGGEIADGVHAVAAIVAAQLGCVLPEAPVESLNDVKTATA
ncbi:MAG TPA: hypothetical protein VKH42_04905 [Vicinamibacterales bacterium]|nr:hypothetical protein [Vicinamibacterales bacterium]